MHYDDFIEHLFNLQILSDSAKYSNSCKDYLDKTLDDKIHILRITWQGDTKYLQSVIDYTKKNFTGAFTNNTKDDISKYLESLGIFDEIGFDLKITKTLNIKSEKNSLMGNEYAYLEPLHLLPLFSNSKYEKLNSYIFGEKHFIKHFPNLRSSHQFIQEYLEIINNNFCYSFISFIHLIEKVGSTVINNVEHTNKLIKKTVFKTRKSDISDYIISTHNSLELKINNSQFILIEPISINDFKQKSSLSLLLLNFSKANNISEKEFENSLQEIISFFTNNLVLNNLNNSYNKELRPIKVKKDEVFAFIQNRNELHEELTPDNISQFSQIEKQLIDEGYFDEFGNWIKDRGRITSLVSFILHCQQLGYFKTRFKINNTPAILKLKRFFETRYGINISKQFQNEQRKKIVIPNSEFNWIQKAK